MDKQDTNAIIIAIPKRRLYDKPYISERKDENMKKEKPAKIVRHSEATIKKYTLQKENPIPAKSMKSSAVLFSYASYAKNERSLKHKQRLAIGLIEKYKVAYIDLRTRLHVDYPVDDVITVTDFDETFFHQLNGRPLPNHKIPIYKSLKDMLSKHMRIRYEIGCKRDCVINIEAKRRRENAMYDICMKRYKKHVKLFDHFISEDYLKSMEFLEKCDVSGTEVIAKIENLRHLAARKLLIISRFVGLDFMYGQQQKYGRFLFYLSPPSWRLQHREFARSVEIEAKGFDLGTYDDQDTFNVIFEKMRSECASGLIKPALYFEQPEHLINIFEAFEEQQLNHITYLNHLAPLAHKLKKDIKQLKELNVADSANVVHMIKYIKSLTEFTEVNEAQLKSNFFKVLNGMFFDSVGDTEVLKMQIHLEFCYEQVFIDQPHNMSISAVAKALESFYMEFCLKLDEIHSKEVKLATIRYIDTQKMKLKRAKKASRELRSFLRMEQSLLRSFAPIPSRNPTTPVLQPRCSAIPKSSRRSCKGIKNNHEPTEAQLEFLLLFTDWSKDEDPAPYLDFVDAAEASQSVS